MRDDGENASGANAAVVAVLSEQSARMFMRIVSATTTTTNTRRQSIFAVTIRDVRACVCACVLYFMVEECAVCGVWLA